jgi:hypothetical protein
MGPLRLGFNRLFGPIAFCAFVVAIIESWLTFPWFLSAPDEADRFGLMATWFWLTAPLQGAGIGFVVGIRSSQRWLGAAIGLLAGMCLDVIVRFVAFMLHHVLVMVTLLPNS